MEYCLWKGEFHLLMHLFIRTIFLPLSTPQPIRRVLRLVEEADVLTSNYSDLKSATAIRV